MRQSVAAFVSGLLFAIGLVVGGMTDPAKVLGFLDFAGAWDPSLAFVMGGAVSVYAILYRVIRRRGTAWFGTVDLPPSRRIDARLVVGSVLFGIGWGLVGFCPGPALVSIASLHTSALVVTASMLAGMGLFHLWQRRDDT